MLGLPTEYLIANSSSAELLYNTYLSKQLFKKHGNMSFILENKFNSRKYNNNR